MSESLMQSQGQSEASEETAAPQTESTEAATGDQPPPSERPEWLPEKYNSPEDLAKAYKELESKIGAKEETLREKIIEELQAEAYGDRPESPGHYELPEFVNVEEAADNELLKWWSDHAYENGYSQEEFQQGIEMYAKALEQYAPDLEAEEAKLGDNANSRIEAASLFANKFFPEEAMPAIERMCESADGIIALEAIMEAMKDGSYSGGDNPTAGMSESDLREMMNDPRYWSPKDRDPHFVKQVEEGFRAIFKG